MYGQSSHSVHGNNFLFLFPCSNACKSARTKEEGIAGHVFFFRFHNMPFLKGKMKTFFRVLSQISNILVYKFLQSSYRATITTEAMITVTFFSRVFSRILLPPFKDSPPPPFKNQRRPMVKLVD